MFIVLLLTTLILLLTTTLILWIDNECVFWCYLMYCMLLICNMDIVNFCYRYYIVMFAIVPWNEICCDTWKTQLFCSTGISFLISIRLFIHPYVIKIHFIFLYPENCFRSYKTEPSVFGSLLFQTEQMEGSCWSSEIYTIHTLRKFH